jgi:hypothetical protein
MRIAIYAHKQIRGIGATRSPKHFVMLLLIKCTFLRQYSIDKNLASRLNFFLILAVRQLNKIVSKNKRRKYAQTCITSDT